MGFGPDTLADISFAFLSILLEGLPFIFLGTLISGFIDAYLPQGFIDRWLPKNRTMAILLSGLLGAVFPVCECAIVPVIRRLIRKGLPISCAVTYMLAAPIINPITLLSTLIAFWSDLPVDVSFFGQQFDLPQHVWMSGSRLFIAYIITVGIGLLIQKIPVKSILKSRFLAGQPKDSDSQSGHQAGPSIDEDEIEKGSRLVAAMRTAMRDCVETGMYFVIGAAITACFNTQVDRELILPIANSDFTAIPAMMVLAFVLSLCSTSDAFIAATLDSVSRAAKLAFLIFGPMMDFKLLFMYHTVFRSKFVAALVVILFLATGLLCGLWSLL